MSSDSDGMIQELRHGFQELIEYVTGAGAQSRTAYEVELHLFRQLLALGAQLLRLFLVRRAAVRPREPVYAADGVPLPYHGQSRTSYYSVFGKVQFERPYFYAADHGGVCPLDAALSLPPRCYSDLLRDWAGYDVTEDSFDTAIQLLARILGFSLAKRALETSVAEDAQDVAAFYDQKAAPPAAQAGPILVVQADGKGVPMVQPQTPAKPARLGKGQQRTQKKEAVVTGIYTITPYQRTPQEVVDALLHAQQTPPAAPAAVSAASSRPAPAHKEVWATLAGKDIALTRLRQRVTQRDHAPVTQRVALTDGAAALQAQVQEKLPDFELILDIIHADEYLWDTANALYGETNPDRSTWVGTQLVQILSGQTATVIRTLDTLAQEETCTPTQREVLRKTSGYYQRNLPYMRYDHYLAHGWPIGTGVIEGTCRHLVKDRMEQTGMRWTQPGAQAILDLRAVRVNGDWDAYQRFRRQRQHDRLYGTPLPTVPVVEEAVLAQAA
ncbi:MAG: ISKra4 family transposase [Chloroflexi bacterium]|nr:ISKra4 family transposase [Chloroflexota bacterium]MBU1749287.1 ISKra4 family transposase [Chloroflexota bacterium]